MRPVPTGLEMDADAFAAELGDRFVFCPHCQQTHLWTKAMAWLEAAAGDEHRRLIIPAWTCEVDPDRGRP